jgi:hypothetical protein
MAAKPENTFISGVHKHIPADIYRMKTNNPYVAGIPDCYYSGSGGALWVEYKFIIVPKRPTTLITDGVSSLQAHWLNGRHEEGRNVAIIIGSKGGGIILRATDYRVINAHEFQSRAISRAEIAGWIIQQVTKR